MRLGVFVGSFNPIHKGHINMMDYLIENNYVDKIIIVPTNSYWDKEINVSLTDRLNMIKCLDKDYLIIEDTLNNIPYTYELLNELQNKYPQDLLFLIMGADNIISFDKWNNYNEILNYKVIVLNRDDIDINKYIKKYHSNNFIVIQNYNYLNISSTKIREKIDEIFLDKKVLEYIKKRKLYDNN